MDADAKERISVLRAQNHSYREIALRLNLPVGSVKSFCSRNRIKRVDEQPGNGIGADCVCQQCGRSVKQQAHRKKKRFCSDACRIQWWNAQRSTQKHRKHRSLPHDNRAV